MLARSWANTRAISTATVHTRASTSTHPATTPASSSHSTPRYSEHDSSAASSTSTGEPLNPISKAQVTGAHRVLARYRALGGERPGELGDDGGRQGHGLPPAECEEMHGFGTRAAL